MQKKRWQAVLGVLLAVVMMITSEIGVCADTGLKGDDGISETPGWPTGPNIQASGAIVVEASSGVILYAKNIYDTFYPASTTKVLTTLVALENSSPEELVEVSYAADHYVSATSSRMGLVEGEQLTMEQALYGIMLESANEATYAVGEHIGGSIAHFIKMMNSKAKALGCEHSHFANTHGLHDTDHYTCCYDMMLIAKAAYQNDKFMEITGTSTYAMPATNKSEARLLTNHHWFLNGTMSYDYCIGGKTGATTEAGYALVTYAKKDGMNLISVVMHAPTWNAVYTDTRNLLEFVYSDFTQYSMEDLADVGDTFPTVFDGIEMFDEDRRSVLSIGEGGVIVLPDNISPTKAVKTVIFTPNVNIRRGDNRIGTIIYNYEDRMVGTGAIIYYNNSDKLTDIEFKEAWPPYMIPVDVAFEGFTGRKASEVGTSRWIRIMPIVFGVSAGVIFLGIGLGIVGARRRRAHRRSNRYRL